MVTCISNPPYNMKWEMPVFAQAQSRFNKCEMPPEGNANYAFILTAIDKADKATFILPCGVLTTSNKQEQAIRKYLVDENLIESIITCPDDMFESTSIPVCLITFNKNKKTNFIQMVDMRDKYEIEIRQQNGQYGGNSHTNRTYKKEIKIITEEQMKEVIECINKNKIIQGFCYAASNEEIKQNDYILQPGRYVGIESKKIERRSYDNIIDDINRVIRDKNVLKITMNETLARNIGFLDLKESLNKSNEIVESMNNGFKAFTDKKILKSDYITLSKVKNEIKIENKDKEKLSEIIRLLLPMWKQHVMYLNSEENRYLTELRDALIPDLMSGKIKVIDQDN